VCVRAWCHREPGEAGEALRGTSQDKGRQPYERSCSSARACCASATPDAALCGGGEARALPPRLRGVEEPDELLRLDERFGWRTPSAPATRRCRDGVSAGYEDANAGVQEGERLAARAQLAGPKGSPRAHCGKARALFRLSHLKHLGSSQSPHLLTCGPHPHVPRTTRHPLFPHRRCVRCLRRPS
jgi:hypothetical protein